MNAILEFRILSTRKCRTNLWWRGLQSVAVQGQGQGQGQGQSCSFPSESTSRTGLFLRRERTRFHACTEVKNRRGDIRYRRHSGTSLSVASHGSNYFGLQAERFGSANQKQQRRIHSNHKSSTKMEEKNDGNQKSDDAISTRTSDRLCIEKDYKASRRYLERSFSKATSNQIIAIWDQSRSIPNIITITRIFSTPVLCHLIYTEQYQYAMAGSILAGFSDWLDGYIAKNYDQKTVLGTYIDPLADKIMVNSVAVSLAYVNVIPAWCAGLWLGRDVLLIGMCYRAAAIAARGSGHNVADPSRTPLQVKPSMISKVNTCLQFGTIGASLGVAAALGDVGTLKGIDLMGVMDVNALEAMCYITSVTTVCSGIGYLDGNSMKTMKKK